VAQEGASNGLFEFVEKRLRASGNDLLGQCVYLNKGITNQAIRFLNIPPSSNSELFHQLRGALSKHWNSDSRAIRTA